MATAICSGYRTSVVFMQSISDVHDTCLGSQVPPQPLFGMEPGNEASIYTHCLSPLNQLYMNNDIGQV